MAAADINKLRRTWFAACKEAGLDEDARKAIQLRVAAKASSADMAIRDFNACLLALKASGTWKPKNPAKKSSKPHVRKIWAMWGQMGRDDILTDPSRKPLAAFVKRQTGVDNPEWLNADQANKVTEALKAWSRRAAATKGADHG